MSVKATSIIETANLSKRVYIVGQYKKPYIELFLRRPSFVGTLNIADADIVVFTGGPDVDPQLYGQDKIIQTHLSPFRDKEDLKAWEGSTHCLRVGICRGAQFLNVMNGGKMWQDVDNHRTSHFMFDLQTSQKIWVTSTHHQQMIPHKDAFKVATCHVSERKEDDKRVWKRKDNPKFDDYRDDWEVLWYEDTASLCFQPHPEALDASEELRTYFFQKLHTAYNIYHSQLLAKAS